MVNKLTETVTASLAGKNIIRKYYKIILNDTVKLECLYQVGIAYRNDWGLLVEGSDLTKKNLLMRMSQKISRLVISVISSIHPHFVLAKTDYNLED